MKINHYLAGHCFVSYARQFLRIMKLTTLIIITCLLQLNAASRAQIYLKADRISLQNVLESISKQSGYDFIYSVPDLKNLQPVSLNLKNVNLETALKICFKDQPLIYDIADRTVVIKKKRSSLLEKIVSYVEGNEIEIRGTIVDEEGKPLPGVNVSIKGSSTTTRTNAAGLFTIRADLGSSLEITCVGYKKQEITVQAKSLIIQLIQDIGNLDQVQIIAYGTVSKRLNTATVSTVTVEVLAQQPVNNVLNALNGRMTGVRLSSGGGGLPGAGISVKVRGDNSFGILGSSSGDPLYVIDGIPQASGTRYDTQNFNANIRGMNGYTNMFNILNMEDVEQIDVLKDADATAIYGARGANGVVVITTKKGKSGRIKINVDLNGGAGKVGHYIPMMNTQQYLELRREAFKNEGITPTTENAPDLTSWDPNAYTDFQSELLGGTAAMQTANLSASGGSEFVNYYVGLNYRKEGTVIARDQHVNRIGGLINMGFTSANRRFNAQISTSYAVEKSNLISDVFYVGMIYLPPNFPLYKTDGSLNWDNNFDNPKASLLTPYKADGTFLSFNSNLSYKVAKGLTLRTTAGYTMNRLENSFQIPAASYNPVSPRASWAWFADSPNSNYTIEPQAEYAVMAGPGKLTALVGGTFSEAISKYTKFKGENYAYDSQLTNIEGAGLVTTEFDEQKYHYASLFARLNYDIQNKYLLNLTFRNDASSRFGPNNRLASFGAVGAAWLFSEEKWIKEAIPFLSFGKLKMSYGTTGNDRIDNYRYLRSYSTGFYPYQNTRTLSPGGAANPNLKWESTKKAELSLNLGFLKDRILFTGNLYRNRSSNMLNYTALASQSGGGSLVSNLDAVVQNKGLELELNTRNIDRGDFSWSSSFNISFERNVLLSFKDQDKASYGAYYRVGETVDAYLTRSRFKYNGVDPVTGAPLYADLDGKPGMSAGDQYIAGLGQPFYGGLNNSFSYKGLTLDVFFKFEHSRGPVNQFPGEIAPGGLMNQNTSVLDRWRQNGDAGTQWPLAVTGSGAASAPYGLLPSSDFSWGNNSYIKLKTASLSYNLPKRWLEKAKLQNVRLSLQGLNLFSITKNKYVLDPEFGADSYPGLRTWMFGINCTL